MRFVPHPKHVAPREIVGVAEMIFLDVVSFSLERRASSGADCKRSEQGSMIRSPLSSVLKRQDVSPKRL
jgi:hypothetical protein